MPRLTLFLTLQFAVCNLHPGFPAPLSSRRPAPVVIVMIDGLSLEQIHDGPMQNLARLVDSGAVGLLNLHGRGDVPPDFWPPATYLTMGCGRRAGAPRAGMEVRASGDLLRVEGMPSIEGYNRRLLSRVRPGALGKALEEGGVDVRLLVEPGVTDSSLLNPALALMDAAGQVRIIGPVPQDAGGNGSPGLLALYCSFPRSRDGGDSPSPLAYADARIGTLVRSALERSGTVLVIGATANVRRHQGLGYVIAAGNGFGRGLLTSATTRRVGLVSVVDVAPTVLSLFGLHSTVQWEGHPARSVETLVQDRLGYLDRIQQRSWAAWEARLPALCLFTALFGLAVAVSLMALRHRSSPGATRRRRWAYLLCLSSLATGLWAYVLPAFAPADTPGWILALAPLPLGCGLGAALYRLGRLDRSPAARHSPMLLLVMLWATVGVVAADLLLGGQLAAATPLGYSLMDGSRYFGIGNEAMAILVASAVLALSLWLDLCPHASMMKARIIFAILFLAALCFAIGAPGLGANTGGLWMATVAAVLFLGGIVGIGTLPTALAGIVLGLCLVAAVAYVDAVLRPPPSSHLGQTLVLVVAEGWPALLAILARKLLFAAQKFGMVLWYGAPILFGITWWTLRRSPDPRLRPESVLSPWPWTSLGMKTVGIASVFGAAVNDSGLGITALCFVGLLIVFLWLCLLAQDEAARHATDADAGHMPGWRAPRQQADGPGGPDR